MKNKPAILAVSGVKNSGKTTLIESIIPKVSSKGYKVAVIKHDGHDFECDVEGTDSYRHRQSGAYGTCIFSKNKFMIVKEKIDTFEEELMNYFQDADLIILEGFKYSDYPKLEIVRKGNSSESVCKKETLLALVTDVDIKERDIKIIDINDIDSISKLVIDNIRRCNL
ncbi:molybdopterin-guanine dinucleotide biosynthesis protein MobB [Clostridium beijerinckii]|uniref:Molybdopterin-guanine dinucleotide biosynthesis protein MobB n=1 Tax=Clostridium beijerinckii TaxID=1520 RepID=A0A0B5QQG0_CLOBE|nr:molybdopterin-guanine dinucleotide biosynthesis protein B [Clostridium beijerinckii]AJH00203.1 molybdopterin-guanine dinucleotide biosynthesis protein MobB [Clostridium beijerinckii]